MKQYEGENITMATSQFPNGFIWSASTSSWQFEGRMENDLKGLSIQDIKENRIADEVCSDHVHHLKEDIELLKELGLNAYRFSISWSRIFPTGRGNLNEVGLNFYRDLIKQLNLAGIKPIVTMYHDDLPADLWKKGGWLNRETIDAFVEYAELLLKEFKEDVDFWQPICEQNILIAEMIAEQKYSLKEIMQINHHMFLAQARVVRLCHELKCKGKIGPALNLVEIYPVSSDPKDVLAAKQMELFRNWFYLDVACYGEYPLQIVKMLKELNAFPIYDMDDENILKQGIVDMISFSHYTSVTVQAYQNAGYKDMTKMKYGFNLPGYFEIVKNPCLGKTEFAYEDDPMGACLILLNVSERYHKPILSIQRGLGLNESLDETGKIHDDKRIRYLQGQLEQLRMAIDMGAEVIGYCTWSAFDLMSTSNGYKKRYGLIYIDRTDEDSKSCQRIKKDSYYWFSKVIHSNGKVLY